MSKQTVEIERDILEELVGHWEADIEHRRGRRGQKPVIAAMEKTLASAKAALAPWFRNHYRCERCGTEWVDEWECACNDRCPECNTEIEPHQSEEAEAP